MSVEPEPAFSLARNSIGLVRNVAQPIAYAGPTAGTAVLAGTMAAVTGTPGATGFLLGIIDGALLCYVYSYMARHFTSAGASYFLVGVLVGTRAAVVVGLLMVAGYFVGGATAVTINSAEYVGPALDYINGPDVAWGLAAIVVCPLMLLLTLRHVRLFTSVLFTIEICGFIGLCVVGVTVLVNGAHDGKDLFAAFALSGITLHSLFFGVIVAFSAVGVFDSSLVLSEETQDSKRIVPRAMWTSLVVAGAIYTFGSWFQFVGFGSVEALASSPAPLFELAQREIGHGFAFVLTCLVIVAAIAAASAGLSAGSRLMWAMVRDGFGPRSWVRVDPVTRSPTRVIVFGTVVSAVIWAPLAIFGVSGNDAFNYVITTGSLFSTVGFLIVALVAAAWFVRLRDPLRVVIAVLAALAVGYALYSTLIPVPPAPLRYLPWGVGAYLIIAVLVVLSAGGLVRRIAASPCWQEGRAARDSLLTGPRDAPSSATVPMD